MMGMKDSYNYVIDTTGTGYALNVIIDGLVYALRSVPLTSPPEKTEDKVIFSASLGKGARIDAHLAQEFPHKEATRVDLMICFTDEDLRLTKEIPPQTRKGRFFVTLERTGYDPKIVFNVANLLLNSPNTTRHDVSCQRTKNKAFFETPLATAQRLDTYLKEVFPPLEKNRIVSTDVMVCDARTNQPLRGNDNLHL